MRVHGPLGRLVNVEGSDKGKSWRDYVMRKDEKPSWREHLTRVALWFTAGALLAAGILLFAE